MKQNKTRKEVDPTRTWDLSALFASDDVQSREVDSLEKDTDAFVLRYKGNLKTPQMAAEALEGLKDLLGRAHRAGNYSFLRAETDSTDADAQNKKQITMLRLSAMQTKLQFVEQFLREQDEAFLNEVKQIGDNSVYIEEMLRVKTHALSPEVEDVISALSPVLGAGYTIYNRAKLADLRFPDFTVGTDNYPMSFGLFEGHYENEPDTEIRREAFDQFYDQLGKYRHTMAATLTAEMQKEKILAHLRGFDSVIDSLLFRQNVDRKLYERQLQGIMNDLAPVMRRYADTVKKAYGLSKMRFADLLVPLDPAFEPEVSIQTAKETLLEALSPLGDTYRENIRRAFDERWIDFPENEGKSTGAFCSSPYGAHPYVLISWTGSQRELFVLAHELGHAGHFALAQDKQNILHTRPSQYLIEAPSTMNELFLADYLLQNTDDPRMKRWIRATMIARTYYHNFVTHGIEAVFQNKAYQAVDRGEGLSADTLDGYFREILEDFWGDAVTIEPGAERTWMRQPHYYMGLYPYVYSAGLTMGTEANRRINAEGDAAVQDWIRFLEAGGTKDVFGLAEIAGIDLTTDGPLKNTIAKIEELVDGLE